MTRYFIAAALAFVLPCSGRSQVKPHAKDKPVPKCSDGGMAGGGYTEYTCINGKWVEDVEGEKQDQEYEAHKQKLASALTTRVLTPAEMSEVLSFGPDIFVQPMQAFFQDDVDKRFVTALDIQRELRLMAADEKKQRCAEEKKP